MTLLVTGGAGFIGSNLVKYVEHHSGEDIVVIDDLSTGRRENLVGTRARLVVASILAEDILRQAMTGCRAVVHLAALPSVPRSIKEPRLTHEVNATGTLCVLEAARTCEVEHVVVASSSSVYGDNKELPKREDAWLSPLSPYAVSKLATEAYANAYSKSFGLETIAFRFFNVFGPGQAADHEYAAVLPKFISAALAGEVAVVEGDGEQTRDFTFVDTVCEVIMQASHRRLNPTKPLNLAFGTRTSIMQALHLIEHQVGSVVATRHSEPRLGDVRDSTSDPTALKALFPAVIPVSLEAGLRATIQWQRNAQR
jgi:UDP-glucose 4-epimerase